MEVRCGDSGFTEAPEADDLGDDERIPTVVLGLANIHAAQGVGLNSIDDMDRVTFPSQMRIKGQPVMAGGLHSKDNLMIPIRCLSRCFK